MAEYIERRMTSNKLYDVYEYVKRNIIADGKPVDASLVKNIMLRFEKALNAVPNADVAPVRHERCDVCSGNSVLTQDAYNGYSLEIDAEQQEAAVWYGDECLAVFHIDFCPNCGAIMDLED